MNITNKETIIGVSKIVEQLKKKKLTREQIASILTNVAIELTKTVDKTYKKTTFTIPATVFSNPKLGPLESIVKYLRENCSLSITKIAGLLNRKNTAISTTYHYAKTKVAQQLHFEQTAYEIETNAFNNPKFSILESLVLELRKKYALRNSEIARLLHRDDRTIWTVISRAKKRGVKI